MLDTAARAFDTRQEEKQRIAVDFIEYAWVGIASQMKRSRANARIMIVAGG